MNGEFAGIRSLLFAPGNDARKLRKALSSEADAVVADLEDAVAPADKRDARQTVAAVFADVPPRSQRFVRINAPETGFSEADLASVAALDCDGLMVPKATPTTLDVLDTRGPPVLALIETAAGVRDAYVTAAHPRVAALMLGGADLAAESNLEVRADGQELLFARSTLVFASTAARIRSPFDVVHQGVHDSEAQEHEARMARSLGFGGKACVHPAQLDGVHKVFTPSAEETEHAQQIVAAYDSAMARGDAVALLHGRLIDQPIVLRARSIIAHASG